MSLTSRRPSGRSALDVARFLAFEFRIDNVPVGDDQGRAVLDLQDHPGADGGAAEQTGAGPHFHQGIGAGAAGDGGGHVVQGVGIRFEIVQADGQVTSRTEVPTQKNDPAQHGCQTEEDAGYGESRAALARMVNSAQRQAAQEDGDEPRHEAKQRNGGHADNHRGDRRPRPAARSQGTVGEGVPRKAGGGRDCRPRKRLHASNLVDRDPQLRLAAHIEDPPGRGTVEGTATVFGMPAGDVMDRAATRAGHDLASVGDGNAAVRTAGAGLAVPGSSVRIGRISQHVSRRST